MNANILIVDDEPGIRFILTETLAHDGHRVTSVESGEAALELVENQDFDLVLIDLKLRGMSGIEFLAALRRRSPDTVIIILTGHGSLETAVEALRQGAHDYLFKPCKTVEIRESVRTGLLKREQKKLQRNLVVQLQRSLDSDETLPPPPPSAKPPDTGARFMRRAGLIVDLMRHVITLDGHLLELSPTEFDLLAYLVGEAPRVVSPQELVRQVQGYDSAPWEARDIVRYHIYRIRRKMKQAANRSDILRTVRGVGYTIS